MVGRWAGSPLAVAGMVAVTVLAGCSDPQASAAAADDPFAGLADDVEVGDTVGAITGVVVDAAIRPLANATVEVVSTGANTTTDATGRFAFEDLEPGTYFLRAAAYRHEPTQVSVDVVAGSPSTVRILLVRVGGAEPYKTTLHFEGYIDAWLGIGQFAVELVSPGTIPCTCAWTFPVDANLTSIVFESTGSSSIPNPGTPVTDDGDAYWELISENGEGQIMSAYDDWPFVKRFEATDFDNASGPFLARITGGVPPSGQMDYDLFITLWYHDEAPAEWSLLAGDA